MNLGVFSVINLMTKCFSTYFWHTLIFSSFFSGLEQAFEAHDSHVGREGQLEDALRDEAHLELGRERDG